MTEAPSRTARARRRPFVALGVVAGLLASIVALSATAGAGTSITPSGPGAVGADSLVRDDSITISENVGGRFLFRSSSSGTFGQQSGIAAQLAQCAGDNTATGGRNNTPRTTIEVKDPGGNVIHTALSPVKNTLATGEPVVSPQPAPSNTNFRGGPMSTTVQLAGQPSGVYTVTTRIQDTTKTGLLGACTKVNLPDAVQTFEYRPWQETFTDILGAGKISFNITPVAESQQQLGSVTGAIVPGGMSFFALPSQDAFALPSDPAACAADPASCLPSAALECDPADGCTPRIVIINRRGGGENLTGVFDLETRAFIAAARIGHTRRVLLSLGPDVDTMYRDLIAQLRTGLAAQGLDIDELLDLKVVLSNGKQQWELSLLNALQINPATYPNGVHIVTDLAVQAGLMLNIYAGLGPATPECTTKSGASLSGDEAFAHSPGVAGMDVETSDLLIDLPTAAGLDALGVGGPIYHIEGNFAPGAATSTVLAGTQVDPDGELLSLDALLTAPLASHPAQRLDFIGTANWVASETNAGALGCLTVDFMLGVGIALLNNPLPLGFGDLPIWDDFPVMDTITEAIDSAVADLVGQVTTNPVVADLLDQLLAQVPDVTP